MLVNKEVKACNSIHRCPEIMGHVSQKACLGLISSLRCAKCFLKLVISLKLLGSVIEGQSNSLSTIIYCAYNDSSVIQAVTSFFIFKHNLIQYYFFTFITAIFYDAFKCIVFVLFYKVCLLYIPYIMLDFS